MGRFVPEVENGYLANFPTEESTLKAFLPSFDVTWAKKRRAFGSELSVYLLKPESHMERAFGFESEILTVYSKYDELQPRTIQAINRFLSDDPARGRVDTMITFLISEAEAPVSWAQQYMTSNPEAMLIAAFKAKTLRDEYANSWLVRSLLAEQLYQRDLFDHRLPLKSDYFFFGREDLIYDLHSAFKRSENRGLFGLRKTGKTSVFFKLERLVETADDDVFVYLDCKYPPIRSLRWEGLLSRLANELSEKTGRSKPSSSVHASDAFLSTIQDITATKKIAIVFDEIEYIGPYNPIDEHWRKDFIPFWQTIWAAQSRFGNLAVFIGGVNPGIVEQDLIEGSQNPLFGIVPHKYLGGLRIDEVRRMLRTLGRPMGLRFPQEAVEYIFGRYGGHPLLTRIACSIMHRILRESGERLPATITPTWLRETEAQREAELSFYCGHIVSELRQFYPDEYDLLKELATGRLADVFELTSDLTFTAHLNNYGLLQRDRVGRPSISIPVLERYVGLQAARDDGRQTILEVVPRPQRNRWLENRKRTINENIEQLHGVISDFSRPPLFGVHSYPESHRFFRIAVVRDETDFASFINICNRCFVEPVENYGSSIGKQDYFWQDIKNNYPALSEALRRIKIYRHHRVHIRLKGIAVEELQFFLERDLGGRQPASVQDIWFLLQQCVLDDLLIGTLVEIDRLT